ncbi:MAG: hypothetical protein WC050_01940 [Candidatus Paceibacterota bacterium]
MNVDLRDRNDLVSPAFDCEGVQVLDSAKGAPTYDAIGDAEMLLGTGVAFKDEGDALVPLVLADEELLPEVPTQS